MRLEIKTFGKTSTGEDVFKYVLDNEYGTKIEILSYGGIVQSIFTADKNGNIEDICLGYDSLKEYEKDPYYMGAVVGRVANRISNAEYFDGPFLVKLTKNAAPHHLHGGTMALNKVVWDAKPIKKKNSVGVELTFCSPSGDNGYPGTVNFKLSYLLTNTNKFLIYFQAETDKRTPINLTSHIYFNLSAGKCINVLDHYLMINALKHLDTSPDLIPSGKANYVHGSAANFSRGKVIGEEIEKTNGGYDHTFVINKEPGKFAITAKVIEPLSGRIIEIITDQPSLQFYTANSFDGKQVGKNEKVFVKHAGLCLETQGFPDAPNQAGFPSVFINPGEKYSHHTQINFELNKD